MVAIRKNAPITTFFIVMSWCHDTSWKARLSWIRTSLTAQKENALLELRADASPSDWQSAI
jgi:hypothetical protein